MTIAGAVLLLIAGVLLLALTTGILHIVGIILAVVAVFGLILAVVQYHGHHGPRV